MIDFKRKQEAAILLTKLLKMGKVYDPVTRIEALKTLQSLLSEHPQGNLIEKYPEAENIGKMLQLFQNNRKKNIILLVDSIEDEYHLTKKNLCCEIFDCLDSEDNISFILMAKKINRVFSLVQKSQNTVHLYNQLKCFESSDNKKLLLLRGIQDSVEEISNYRNENRNNNYNWIICIISTPDLRTFRSKEEMVDLEENLKELNINLILISVGDITTEKFKKFKKFTDFNDSTIFLDVPEFYNKKEKVSENKNKRPSILNPAIAQLRILMSNISNIKIQDENLIYEQF